MSDKYGVDDKTRFLVLYLDAKMTATEISRIINRSLNTMKHWVSWTKHGDDIRVEGRGRKKQITPETEEKIVRMVKENPEGMTLKKVGNHFGLAHTTISKILIKKGFKYRAFDQSIKYEDDERMMRVEFCNKMLSDEGKLIYRTFFSDEMGVELNRISKNRAWQLANEKIRKKNVAENIKLECWGAISAQGATSLDIYKKGMNGEIYRRIIESHKAEMEALYPDGEFYFIHDFHPVHRMNEEWIVKEQKLELIKLPRKSSDLNMVIEHLWIALKDRVDKDNPNNEKELRASLLKNWEILTHPGGLQPYFEKLHGRYMKCVMIGGDKIPGN